MTERHERTLNLPYRLLCGADERETNDEFQNQLTDYLLNHCPSGLYARPNAGFMIVPVAWVDRVTDFQKEQLSELVSDYDGKQIPMQTALNALRDALNRIAELEAKLITRPC